MADLLDIVRSGAKIQIDRPEQVITQFDDLVATIKNLVVANEKIINNGAARAAADHSQAQSNLEVLATLQALIKKLSTGVTKSPPLDLTPLQTVLSQIAENKRTDAPHDYEFTFTRGPQGYTTKIHARVVSPA